MRINFAHFWERATNGTRIECAVFEANSNNGSDTGRAAVLRDLTSAARQSGLKIDQSALAYEEHGEIMYYGNPHLVDYLANTGLPQWTNTIDI